MERWTFKQFPLASGKKAYKGGIAVIKQSTGKCEPASAAAGLLHIGKFAESIDASAAEKLVNVDLGLEIEVCWWTNDTTAPVTADKVGSICYLLDDQTVSIDGTSRSIAGRVWAVDATKGVAVQKLGLIVTPPAAFSLGRGDADTDDDAADVDGDPDAPTMPPPRTPVATPAAATPTRPASPAPSTPTSPTQPDPTAARKPTSSK
jgi:hypothetical protein